MCQACDELTLLLAKETLESELMGLQREAGFLPASAVRPLMVHETAVQAWFTELEDDLDRGVAEAVHAVEAAHAELAAVISTRLVAGGQKEVAPQQLIERLKKLQSEKLPKQVEVIIDRAVKNLEQALTRVYQYAALRVIQERARQTGDTTEYALPTMGPRARDLAKPAVERSWTQLLNKTQEHLADPALVLQNQVSTESVKKAVESISVAGVSDQARQGVHAATGLGRVETAMDHDVDEIYASELLDGNTCRACASVDGTKYEDMEEATSDYPAGYYQGCSGGARCRGSLLFLFTGGDKKATPRMPDPALPSAMDPSSFPEPTKRVDRKMMEHIAGLDKRGRGGHVFGHVREGKTVFPADWDMAKIVDAADRAITHGGVTKDLRRGIRRELDIDGVKVVARGMLNAKGEATFHTAYPEFGAGVYGTINGVYIPLPDAAARREYLAEVSGLGAKV